MSKSNEPRIYTVNVDGQSYNVTVVEGANAQVEVKNIEAADNGASVTPAPATAPAGGEEVLSQVPGSVWKIVANSGQAVNEGDVIMILESMKMEIEIFAPRSGTLKLLVATNDKVVEGQVLAVIG